MSKKRTVSISYTSREFDSIKADLLNYVKRYYPNTFRDFNEASFGSLMIDTVAYIGDILSFYIDYQANETFLETAAEYENILKIGKQLGFKFRSSPPSVGTAAFYIMIPALSSGLGPDLTYLPILKRSSSFGSRTGSNFILNEDVHFGRENNEIRVARVNESTGKPTYGTVSDRLATGALDYSANGKKVVRYSKVMDKLSITRDAAETAAIALGITIPAEQFEVVVAKKGRPPKNKDASVSDTESEASTTKK